jgi:beta-phosphoglucomutase family hydrolase
MLDAKAFLFDLNGTMVDDMHYHIAAWHNILTTLGANISLERTKTECYGKNDELLERIFPGRFSLETKIKMGQEKEHQYRQNFMPNLRLLPGLASFLADAKANNIAMAIGSAAIISNIDFVVDNLQIRHYFDAIVSADHVKKSKPDPETFISCASQLNVAPKDCIVFEDAPKGVEAALNANMRCIVLTTMHEAEEFAHFSNVVKIIKDYTDFQ